MILMLLEFHLKAYKMEFQREVKKQWQVHKSIMKFQLLELYTIQDLRMSHDQNFQKPLI